VSFAVLSAGVPWCAGAFFHAFDMPVFFAWFGLAVLLAALAASLFFRWALIGVALLEILVNIAFCMITPVERFRGTVWQPIMLPCAI